MKRRRKRRDPSDRAVRAVMSETWRDTPEAAEAHDAHRLLADIAMVLNACEDAGIPVRLAHGAVLTPVGYVLPVFPDAGERFAVRTMALTEFPVQAGDDD